MNSFDRLNNEKGRGRIEEPWPDSENRVRACALEGIGNRAFIVPKVLESIGFLLEPFVCMEARDDIRDEVGNDQNRVLSRSRRIIGICVRGR